MRRSLYYLSTFSTKLTQCTRIDIQYSRSLVISRRYSSSPRDIGDKPPVPDHPSADDLLLEDLMAEPEPNSQSDTNKEPSMIDLQKKPLSELEPTTPSAGTAASPLRATSFDYHKAAQEAKSNHFHIHVHATANNTMLTLTNYIHNPVMQSSGGSAGFKKSQRSGYEAGYQAMLNLLKKMSEKGIRPNTIDLVFYGFGQGREASLSAFSAPEYNYIKQAVASIKDGTKLKFGGCKPPKARRL